MIIRYTVHNKPTLHVAVLCDIRRCRAAAPEAGNDENAIREARSSGFVVGEEERSDRCALHARVSVLDG